MDKTQDPQIENFDEVESTYNVAQDGDIVLIVGPSTCPTKIRVQSVALTMGSRVFKAMLGPHFLEGCSREFNGMEGYSKEIVLPDDDVEGMKIVCNVLHHRNNEIPPYLDGERLLEVAVIADKYDCFEALRFVSAFWFVSWERWASERWTPEDGVFGMTAAYIFNNEVGFRCITNDLIRRHKGSFLSLLTPEILDHVPLVLLCK